MSVLGTSYYFFKEGWAHFFVVSVNAFMSRNLYINMVLNDECTVSVFKFSLCFDDTKGVGHRFDRLCTTLKKSIRDWQLLLYSWISVKIYITIVWCLFLFLFLLTYRKYWHFFSAVIIPGFCLLDKKHMTKNSNWI